MGLICLDQCYESLGVRAVAQEGAAVEGVILPAGRIALQRSRRADQQSCGWDVAVLVENAGAGDAVREGRFVQRRLDA